MVSRKTSAASVGSLGFAWYEHAVGASRSCCRRPLRIPHSQSFTSETVVISPTRRSRSIWRRSALACASRVFSVRRPIAAFVQRRESAFACDFRICFRSQYQ